MSIDESRDDMSGDAAFVDEDAPKLPADSPLCEALCVNWYIGTCAGSEIYCASKKEVSWNT